MPQCDLSEPSQQFTDRPAADVTATYYASGLIAAGCDVVTVQRSLGHAKATTTLNTYAHLWPTAEDRTRKAAESIMSAPLGRQAANRPQTRLCITDHDVKLGQFVIARS